MLLLCSTLPQWECRGNPKIIVFHTYLCPKVLLSLYDPASGGSWGGEGCGFCHFWSVLGQAKCALLRCGLCLVSWSLLRQRLFLFGFSFWSLGFPPHVRETSVSSFELRGGRFHRCLPSAAAPSRGGPAPARYRPPAEQRRLRSLSPETTAQTRCLACFWLSPAEKKVKSLCAFWPWPSFQPPSEHASCLSQQNLVAREISRVVMEDWHHSSLCLSLRDMPGILGLS